MPLGPGPLLVETAARFALLGDPRRLLLVSVLCDRGEMSVGELARTTDISMANTSQHLQRLTSGGVLSRRKSGQQVYYSVVEDSIEPLCEIVCASVQDRASVLHPGSVE